MYLIVNTLQCHVKYTTHCVVNLYFMFEVSFSVEICDNIIFVMKKIFNFRPMVFFAIFLIVGVISVTYYISMRISLAAFVVIASILFLSALAGIVLMFAFKENFNLRRLGKRILLCTFAVWIGGASVGVNYSHQASMYIKENTYDVQARICEVPVINYDSNYLSLVLDDAIVEYGGKHLKLSKKIKVYFSGDLILDDLEIGNVIEFSAKIRSIKMMDENEIKRDYNYIANDIYYMGTAKSEIVVLDEFRVNIFEKIKLKTKDILYSGMNDDYASIGYGMIFGEDAFIPSEMNEVYRDAGISHLLAVSGLHVGFVVLLLSWILSLFKINDRISSAVLISLLFIYVILCGFATSVVRAFIMTTCMLIAKVFRKPYDSLSSLSFAAVIILIFAPLELFTAGFQLSFMAVLGILLLAPTFMKIFSKFLFEQFASSLSLSLAASIGIMPIMAIQFEKFSALSVFTNMIVIPIASIAFMFLFVAIIFAMIIPGISMIVVPFEYIMRFVTAVGSIAAGASVNLYHVNMGSSVLFLTLGISAVVSEYIRLKPLYKLLSILFLIKCIMLYFIVDFILIILL